MVQIEDVFSFVLVESTPYYATCYLCWKALSSHQLLGILQESWQIALETGTNLGFEWEAAENYLNLDLSFKLEKFEINIRGVL